jgi:hypothetical protein
LTKEAEEKLRRQWTLDRLTASNLKMENVVVLVAACFDWRDTMEP